MEMRRGAVRIRRVVLAGVAAVALVAAVPAGEARADRPFNITSRGSITAPGDLYTELGVSGFLHGQFLRELGTTLSPTLGVVPRVEVFLFGTLAREYDYGDNNAPDETNPLADPALSAGPIRDESDRRIDIIDPSLGVRVALLEGYLAGGDGPSIVGDLVLLFPETRKPAPDHLGFDAIIEASQYLIRDRLDLHVNLGYELETSREQLCGIFYSAALELKVPGTENLFALCEYAGTKFETLECDGTVLAGLQYTVPEPLFLNEAYLDLAVFRSDRGDPDWGFTVGISVGFGALPREEEEEEEGSSAGA
jgi:hypothetical protein